MTEGGDNEPYVSERSDFLELQVRSPPTRTRASTTLQTTCPSHVRACTPQAFYESGEDNAVFLSKLEEIKATHR